MDSQTIREAIGQPLVLRSLKSNLAHMVEGVVNSIQIFSMGISLIATFYPHPLIMDFLDSFFFSSCFSHTAPLLDMMTHSQHAPLPH